MTTTELAYDVCVKKHRVVLNLDEDVVEAAQVVGVRHMSAIVNEALRKNMEEKEAHQRALLEWLDELDAEFGAPTKEQLAAADAELDELHRLADEVGAQ